MADFKGLFSYVCWCFYKLHTLNKTITSIETSVELHNLNKIFDYFHHFFFLLSVFYSVILTQKKRRYVPNVIGKWSKIAEGGLGLISLYEKKKRACISFTKNQYISHHIYTVVWK